MLLQLTLVNTEYLRSVTSAGDEWQLSATYLPSVMRSALRQLLHLVGDLQSLITFLADANCDAVDRWRTQLSYPPGFQCLGVGAWLANNDTHDKAAVLSSLNITDMTVIYAAVIGCPDLLTNKSCLHFDDNATFSAAPASEFMRALLSVRGGNISLENTTYIDVVLATLCRISADSSFCFDVPRLQRLAYVRVVSAYVTMHLAAYVFYRAVYVTDYDLVVTRSQNVLALGDGRPNSGILEHYIDEASASNGSQLVTVYNCYDAIFAVSNGHWKCKYSRRCNRLKLQIALLIVAEKKMGYLQCRTVCTCLRLRQQFLRIFTKFRHKMHTVSYF